MALSAADYTIVSINAAAYPASEHNGGQAFLNLTRPGWRQLAMARGGRFRGVSEPIYDVMINRAARVCTVDVFS